LLDFVSLGVVLESFPGVAFVAHGPMWWQHLGEGADSESPVYPRGRVRAEGLACKFLERYPNLFADISAPSGFNALHRDHEFAKRFLTKFKGSILFGTDNDASGHAELIDSLGLGSEVTRRIFGLNSRDVLEFSP
jgi:predicted TIM-barrel fold metal-dependent hydrolase